LGSDVKATVVSAATSGVLALEIHQLDNPYFMVFRQCNELHSTTMQNNWQNYIVCPNLPEKYKSIYREYAYIFEKD
jgi:hypothetical protein